MEFIYDIWTVQSYWIVWEERWISAMVLSKLWKKSKREMMWKGRREKSNFSIGIAEIVGTHFLYFGNLIAEHRSFFFFFFFGILAMMPKYILKNIILIYFNNIFINKKNSINILLNPFFPFHRSKFKLYLYIFWKSAHNHFEIVWNY